MSPEDFERSFRWLLSLWERLDIFPTFLTIEYVGGEILLIPPAELDQIVRTAREVGRDSKVVIHDGVQSNLIGSARRIEHLSSLFFGRVGTSIDTVTEQRRLRGSAEAYLAHFFAGDRIIQARSGRPAPAVFTMDAKSISSTSKQVREAAREGRDLTIRPVFQGGSEISGVTADQVAEAMVSAIDAWLLRSMIRLEPVATLLEKRLQNHHGMDYGHNTSFCAFQANCTRHSFSLEPNADLYVCQELADAGQGRLGNALTGEFNEALWREIDRREENLPFDCKRCSYLAECRGGCMMQSVEAKSGWYGKTPLCPAWKAMFARLDDLIDQHGPQRLEQWLSRIEARQKQEAALLQ